MVAGAGFYKEAFTAAGFIIMAVNLAPLVVRFFGPSKLRERKYQLIRAYFYFDGSLNE